MTRSYCTPRTIRFHHNFIVWYLCDHLQLFFRLQRTTVDSNVKTKIDKFLRFVQCAIERMDNAAVGYFRRIPLQNVVEISKRIATMQEQWQIVCGHEIQLTFEIDSLHIGRTKFHSIVVQSTFTDCHNFAAMRFNCRTQLCIILIG